MFRACVVSLLMDNTILVSRTLSDGRQLEIRTAPDREVITTIGGVVQPGFSGGMCVQPPMNIMAKVLALGEWHNIPALAEKGPRR